MFNPIEQDQVMQAQISTNTVIPLYTPSLIDPQILAGLLSHYDSILTQLIGPLLAENPPQPPALSIIIGPPGCGKTHFLSLFYQRISNHPQIASRYQTLWLSELEWEITHYDDLLIRLLNLLVAKSDFSVFNPAVANLYDLPAAQFQSQAEALLLQILAAKPLILLAENIDMILAELAIVGQQQLKKLLRRGKITLVATATTFAALTDSDSPLAKSCSVIELAPLALDEILALLDKVVQTTQQAALIAQLNSPAGQLSISTLHHLAGSIPRIYLSFIQRIQQHPLAEFSQLMLQIVDDLTPRYQAMIQRLPAQQRKLMAYLSQQKGTTTVAEIAKYNRISQQTTSGQLKKLRGAGLVVATSVGRESHYEIADPLLRLTLQLKQTDLGSITAKFDFLRHWFTMAAQYLPDHNGLCFSYDRNQLYRHYLPTTIPLIVKLQHRIENYLTALKTGSASDFTELRTKLNEIAQQLSSTSSAIAHQEHIQLLYTLIYANLQHQLYDAAEQLCDDLLTVSVNIDRPSTWLVVSQISVGLSALFAQTHHITKILPLLNRLEKQETTLINLTFSIHLCHCLVNKAKGLSLLADKGRTQQTLEQLRLRAEKRNNPDMAAAFGHAVKATLRFICNHDNKLAFKLFKQIEEIDHRYHNSELLLSCSIILWDCLPDAFPFEQLLAAIEPAFQYLTFAHQTLCLFQAIATKDLAYQVDCHTKLWATMTELGCQPIFAMALIQLGVQIANQNPTHYFGWLNGCLPLLEQQPALQQPKVILTAVQRYLENGNDRHQLLGLPMEERALIYSGLVADGRS